MAYIKLTNGFEKTVYWTKEECTQHALRYSQTFKKGYGVWKDNFDAMSLKTVLKHLIKKYAPKSVEVLNAISDDQAVVNESGNTAYKDNEPDEQIQPEAQTASAKAKAEEAKAQVEAMKARRSGTKLPADAPEYPATKEEATPAPGYEDMPPADNETGEMFSSQE